MSEKRVLRRLQIGEIDEPAKPLRKVVTEDEIESMAASMAAHGLAQPLQVVKVGGRYEVVFGHRRLLAARRLGWGSIECLVADTVGARIVALRAAENLHRKDLAFSEEAALCSDLYREMGDDVDEVASFLNRSREWVDARLLWFLWPPSLQTAVDEKVLSAASAKELMGIQDVSDREFYIGHGIASGASAALCRAWRQAWALTRTLQDPAAIGALQVDGGPAPRPPELPCFVCGQGVKVPDVQHGRFCVVCLEFIAFNRQKMVDVLRAPGEPAAA